MPLPGEISAASYAEVDTLMDGACEKFSVFCDLDGVIIDLDRTFFSYGSATYFHTTVGHFIGYIKHKALDGELSVSEQEVSNV